MPHVGRRAAIVSSHGCTTPAGPMLNPEQKHRHTVTLTQARLLHHPLSDAETNQVTVAILRFHAFGVFTTATNVRGESWGHQTARWRLSNCHAHTTRPGRVNALGAHSLSTLEVVGRLSIPAANRLAFGQSPPQGQCQAGFQPPESRKKRRRFQH